MAINPLWSPRSQADAPDYSNYRTRKIDEYTPQPGRAIQKSYRVPRSARRSERRSDPNESRASDSPVQRGGAQTMLDEAPSRSSQALT
jgi:hypothetical protein